MPKDTKSLGNNKAPACESRGFVHKKRLCQRFDTFNLMLLFVDDMMQHQVQINAVYVSEGKYDYFSGIRSQAPTRICQIADNTILCSSAETTFALLCSIILTASRLPLPIS